MSQQEPIACEACGCTADLFWYDDGAVWLCRDRDECEANQKEPVPCYEI